jgi:hypothetical protein
MLWTVRVRLCTDAAYGVLLKIAKLEAVQQVYLRPAGLKVLGEDGLGATLRH